MKTSTKWIFLMVTVLSPQIFFAQIFAHDDTLCQVLGENFEYNVKDNDDPANAQTPVFTQQGSSTCIGLRPDGELYFLPDATEACCGLQVLKYRYEGCQAGNPECEAVIYFTIKCPKPDCFLVNLEDFVSPDPNGGGTGEATCAFACENSSSTYYVPFNALNTYNWQVNGALATSPGANAAEIIVTWGPAGPGFIALSTGNPAEQINVCVNILPGPTAAFEPSDSSICCGNSIAFNNTSADADGWFWDFGDGSTSTMFSPSHTFDAPGTYTVCLYVTKNNYDAMGNPLCCCSDSICLDVVVDSLKGPNIYCVSTLCAFDSSSYWTDASSCSSYIWTVLDANGLPIVFNGQGNDSITVNWGDGPQGTVLLEVLGCDSIYCADPSEVVVPIIPSSVLIGGSSVVCENGTASYTVPKWLSTDYNWQVSGGMILSGQGTNTITVQWGLAPGPGTITLNYSSDFLGGLPDQNPENCMGAANLTVQIKPQFSIGGPTTACLKTTTSFFASPAVAYTWSISPPVPFTGQGGNSIMANWNTTAGTYVVTAVPVNASAFCNSSASTVIQVLETLPADTISGAVEICPGETYTYSGQTSQTGIGFLWTVTGGTPASYTGNPITVTWNAIGPYNLSLQLADVDPPNCLSVPIQLNITPKLLQGPLSISGPNSTCINGGSAYSAAPAQHPDAVYNWTISPATLGSVVSGQGSPNISVQWNNDPGAAVLTLSVALCNSTLSTTWNVNVGSAATPTIIQNGILCPGIPATLSVSPAYANYSWTPGPSGPTFQTIPITLGGLYTVLVTDNAGCTASGSFQAVPVAGPVADISTGDPTVLCITPPFPGSMTINALTAPNYEFMWYCDGILQALPLNQAFLTHNNSDILDNFAYQVVVKDIISGCTSTSNTIFVNQIECEDSCIGTPYTLAFTALNQTPNCAVVDFTVTSQTNVTLTGWNFGDPNSNVNGGTLSNASHTYSKAGCFLATLSGVIPEAAPGTGLCAVLETQSVCVPLVARFNFSLADCRKVNFNNLTTLIAGTGPITWDWDFGDPADPLNSSLEHPMHTYSAAGTYGVQLTATNPGGCVSIYTLTVVVPGPPTASISVDLNPCVDEPVQFVGAGSGVVSWLWDFGDGATNALQSPAHAYTSAGVYTVTLTVKDMYGCTASATATVTVHDPPLQANITVAPGLTICAGGSVTLSAPVGPYSYQWSANTGNSTLPVVIVTSAGNYSVTITDANGCTMVPDSVTVLVNPLPTAQISGNPFICDSACTTLQVSGNQGSTYIWMDQSNTPLVPAEIASSLLVCFGNVQAGYSVQVTDANGCSAISPVVTVSLAVSPVFNVTVQPDSCEGSPAILTVVPVQPNVVYTWSNGGSGPSISVQQAGVYNVVGTDTISGCKGYGSQTIHPLPDLCIVPAGCYKSCNPDTICGPDGLSGYQWNLNGLPISGENGQCLIVTQSGTYSLTGTTEFGCELTTDSLVLMLIDCGCEQLSVSAEPAEDSCCWTLSYNNAYGDLYGVVIHSDDTDFQISNLDPALQIFSIGNNTISLVNSQQGMPLPAGGVNDFLKICLQNVLQSPQQIVVDWYNFDYEIACSDTLELDCPVEPDCFYVLADSMYCDGEKVTYTMTVCNPADNAFEVGYFVLMPTTPNGLVVSPLQVIVNPPMLQGECRDFSFVLSGPNLKGDTFCFTLTAHDTLPGPIDTTHCCMLDTTYCIPIPDCLPCDDIGVGPIDASADPQEGYCCINIPLFNQYSNALFDGIDLCLLGPGTQMTIQNPFGSGWVTSSYSPTMIELDAVAPLGNFLPLGDFRLPTICVKKAQQPTQLIEIKWMNGDSVLCRDTVEIFCEPECGYLSEDTVICEDLNTWIYNGLIVNTSAFTMGEAHVVANGVGQTITFPGGLAPGGSYPFSIPIGAPSVAGDTLCFTIALHELNDSLQHINCCNFYACIVLPDCPEVVCVCDKEFNTFEALGMNCTILAAPPGAVLLSPGADLNSCDEVAWIFSDTPLIDTTYGNASLTHISLNPKAFKVCMQVRRYVSGQVQCKYEVCKEVRLAPILLQEEGVILYPNPSDGNLFIRPLNAWPGAVSLRLRNLMGQLIQTREMNDPAGVLPVPVQFEGLVKGVYLLEISSGGKRWVKKVMIGLEE